MKKFITAQLTKSGFRKLLKQLSEHTALSYPEIAKRSGVHFTTIYNGLRPTPADDRKQVRVSTVRKLADGLGFQITLRGNYVNLHPERAQRKVSPARDSLESFGKEIADLLRSLGYKQVSRKERYRIRELIRLMLKT